METNNISSSNINKYKPEKTNKTFTGEHVIDTAGQDASLEGNWHREGSMSYSFNSVKTTSAYDVAAYILKKLGQMTTMKLHKLVYYSQAWALVWDEKPIFKEKIEAWANGPVIRELFAFHRGEYTISNILVGNASNLSIEQKETVDAVIDYYGGKTSQWLIELSHLEGPWKKARIGLSPTERGDKEISHASIAEYYSSL